MSRNNLIVEREKLQFTMSRVFDAPRELLWKAITDPNLIPKWWGPRYMTTVVDKLDLRVGGKWRFVQMDQNDDDPNSRVHSFNGIFKEIQPPERLSYTFEYEPQAGHISADTLILEELPGGKTRFTSVTTFNSLEDLEGMIQAGMESGAEEGWDRLEELVQILVTEK